MKVRATADEMEVWRAEGATRAYARGLVQKREQALVSLLGKARVSTDADVRAAAARHDVFLEAIEGMNASDEEDNEK